MEATWPVTPEGRRVSMPQHGHIQGKAVGTSVMPWKGVEAITRNTVMCSAVRCAYLGSCRQKFAIFRMVLYGDEQRSFGLSFSGLVGGLSLCGESRFPIFQWGLHFQVSFQPTLGGISATER